MTKLVLKQGLDLTQVDLSDFLGGSIDSISPTEIQLSAGFFSADVHGSGMGYNPITDTYSGTVSGVDGFYQGGLVFSATKINVAVQTIADDSSDPAALIDDLFGGNDTFLGSKFDDVLTSFGGNDKIDGGKGADVLIGGAGGDTLTGGIEADSFLYLDAGDSTKKHADLITDLGDNDNINLLALHVTGHIKASYDGVNDLTSFKIDINGDGAADMVINASGDHTDFSNFLI